MAIRAGPTTRTTLAATRLPSTPDGRPAEQQPEADGVQPQLLLGEQHHHGAAGRGQEVDDGDHGGRRPQHPVGGQPAQALGDLDPQGRAPPRGVERLLGRAEVAADGGDQGRPGREGDRVDRERDPGGRREQEPADRGPGQLLGDDLGADQTAVGPLQPLGLAGHERRQDRVRPGVDQRLPAPSRNPTTASRAMLAWSARTATARPATMANRAASTVHITAAGPTGRAGLH
jgi:hypothetical protein